MKKQDPGYEKEDVYRERIDKLVKPDKIPHVCITPVVHARKRMQIKYHEYRKRRQIYEPIELFPFRHSNRLSAVPGLRPEILLNRPCESELHPRGSCVLTIFLSSCFPLLSGESFYYTIKTGIHDMQRNRRIAGGSDRTVISRERGRPGVGLGIIRAVRRDS